MNQRAVVEYVGSGICVMYRLRFMDSRVLVYASGIGSWLMEGTLTSW